MSLFYFFLQKEVKLVGGGSVINGATPSSLNPVRLLQAKEIGGLAISIQREQIINRVTKILFLLKQRDLEIHK